jgi:hypothetical protein
MKDDILSKACVCVCVCVCVYVCVWLCVYKCMNVSGETKTNEYLHGIRCSKATPYVFILQQALRYVIIRTESTYLNLLASRSHSIRVKISPCMIEKVEHDMYR